MTQGSATAPMVVSIVYSGPVPTGAVTFQIPGGPSVTASCTSSASPLTCTAGYPASSLPAGTYAITATEAADANYPQGSSDAILTVATSTAVVAPMENTGSDVSNVLIPYGTVATTLSANIVYSGAAPTGSVMFTVDGGSGGAVPATCSSGSSPLNCTATYPTGSLAIGSYTITATQTADANYPAGDAVGTLTVIAGASGSADSASGTAPYGAASVPLTVTIPFSGAAPTGDITVADTHGNTVTVAASTCSATASALSCAASLPLSNVAAGYDSLTVAEAADPNHAATTGTGLADITKAAGATSDAVSGTGTYGAATTTIAVSIPYAGALAPTGAITVQDGNGNSVQIAAASCTATGSVLSCAGSFPSANLNAGSDAVTVSQTADANYSASSGTGALTINKAAAASNDTASGTGTYGSVHTSVAVSIPYAGAVAPTGTVTVSDGNGNSVQLAASSCTAAAGALSCTATFPSANLAVGGDTLTVTQAADVNYNATTGGGTLTITKAATATSDTANGTGTYGSPTTPVSVSIPFSGAVAPAGAVTVSDGHGNTMGVAASACTAGAGALSCTVSFPSANLPVGTDSLNVAQASDANYNATTGSGTLTINKAAAASNDTAAGSGNYGAATVPVSVNIPYAGVVPPSGSISVSDAHGNTVGIPASSCTASAGVLSCTASFPSANLAVGPDTVTVTQTSDGNYNATSGGGTVTIGKAPAANSDTVGGTGTLGAVAVPVSVSIPYSGATPPSGVITLQDGNGNTVQIAASSCTATGGALHCTANFPTANLAVGPDAVTVSQAADGNYSATTGGGTLTMNKPAAGSGDTATGSGTYGAPTSTVTVTIPYNGTTPPTGAVTVTDAHGNTVTTSASTCSASGGVLTCNVALPSANVPAGNDALSVSQLADANYNASSGVGTLTMAKASTTNIDTASGSAVYGAASIPVTATIPYAGAVAPTGNVTVTDSYGNTVTVAASACTVATGVLTCPVMLPAVGVPAGNDLLTVSEVADSNYFGSTGTGTATISKVARTTSDSVTGTGTYGTATTPISVTIPYAAATAPTGNITVADAHGNTVMLAASSCTASAGVLTCAGSFPSENLAVGPDAVTVTQLGDVDYHGSSGSGTVTIDLAPQAANDTASANGTYGSPTTLVTVTIPYGGATAPSGAVTITDAHGNTVTVEASGCTASGGALSCSANMPSANVPVGPDALTVAQAGDGNYAGTTGTGTLTMGPATTGPLAGPAASVQNVTISQGTISTQFTVTIPYGGLAAPSGAVTFSVASGAPVTANCSGTASPLVCTAVYPTASLVVGTYPIVASQAADGNYPAASGSATLTVGTGAVSPILNTGSSVQSLSVSQGTAMATLNATIAYTRVAPTGAVTFVVASGSGGTVVANCTSGASPITCTASYPVATLAPANYTITATEAADSNFPQGSATATLTITPAGQTIAPLSSTGSSVGNQTITYGTASATLTAGIVYTGAAPTGVVMFAVAGASGGSVSSTCTSGGSPITCIAIYPTTSLGRGSYTIAVTQAADANYPMGNASGTLTVTKVPVTTGDTASGSGYFGVSTVPLTVTIPFSGAAAPTGQITVTDAHGNSLSLAGSGCTVVASALQCSGNFPAANLLIGPDAVTVSQGQDANYAGSTGSGTVTINPAASDAIDTVNGTGTYGSVTSPVTVVIPYKGAVAPMGAITVDGPNGGVATVAASTCTNANSTLTCVVNLPTGAAPVGQDALAVTQSADANHEATTGSGTLTLAPASAAASETVSGAGVYGAATSTATVVVPYAGVAAPTGAVTVNVAGGISVTVPASICAAANGRLTCLVTLPTSTLAAGTIAITSSQAADANYGTTTGIGSLVLTKSVGNVVTITTSPLNIGAGTAVTTLKVAVAYSGAAAPTGGLTLTVGNGASIAAMCIGTASPLTCTVTYPTAALATGTYVVTATESADTNYAAASGTGSLVVSSGFTFNNQGTTYQTVIPGDTTSYAFALSPVSVNYPGLVTLTITGCPTGAVCTVSPGSVAATGGSQTVTLTVVTQSVVAEKPSGSNPWSRGPVALALLLPVLLRRRTRKQLGSVFCALLLVVAGFASMAGLTGCAQHNGFFQQGPANYTITVTATSGGTSQSAQVTLNVQ